MIDRPLNSHIIQKESRKSINKNNILEFELFHSFEELASFQQEWDKFIESIEGEIFLTYDWCRVWWKYYGNKRDLMIFVFRNGNNICGILPLFKEKIWVGPISMRVIKVVGTDFTPITQTIPINKDFISIVMDCFINQLMNNQNWDILYLGPICGRYESFDNLVTACSNTVNNFYNIKIKRNDVQTYFEVADSWDSYIASLSRNQRKSMRRAYKELQERGIALSSEFVTKERFENDFNDFVEMHQSQWQKLRKPGHFGAWPKSYEFHHEIASIQLDHNRLRLLKIKLDDDCIGYVYMYKFGKTYYAFLNSRRDLAYYAKIEFHRISFGEKIEKANQENVRCIDLMRGKYEYKILLGGKLLPINHIYIHSKNLFLNLKIHIFRMLVRIIDILYAKLWRNRIASRLGIATGSFCKIWIKTNGFS